MAPVLIGTALAARDRALHWPAVGGALAGALLLQIGTNFANDYGDFVTGADTAERLGPTRATQAGLVQPKQMRTAAVVTFGLATLVGVGLVARGGWPIAAIGVGGILSGVFYTAGRRPLGYLGLGELLVFGFFGPIAVAGTYWVSALRWSTTAVVAGLATGALATALLVVNNLRDIEQDAKAGKGTLAVRLGRNFAKGEYGLMLIIAMIVPVVLWWQGGPPALLLAVAACALSSAALRDVLGARPGDRLLTALAATGRTLAVYGIAMAVGWIEW